MENAFADVAVADGALVKVETLPTVGGHARHTACCRPVPSQYPGPNAGCIQRGPSVLSSRTEPRKLDLSGILLRLVLVRLATVLSSYGCEAEFDDPSHNTSSRTSPTRSGSTSTIRNRGGWHRLREFCSAAVSLRSGAAVAAVAPGGGPAGLPAPRYRSRSSGRHWPTRAVTAA